MNKSIVSATVLAALLPLSAAAEDTGFYFGGSVGWAYQESDFGNAFDELGDINFDDDDFGWKGFVGWEILPVLAIEGGYVDFGEVDNRADRVRSTISSDGWDAFLVGNLPLGFIDLFAKIGVISYNSDVKFNLDTGDSVSDDDSSTDPAYGVGAALELGSFSIRGE